MDVKTRYSSTLKLLNCACQLQEFTCKGLQNQKYTEVTPTTSMHLILACILDPLAKLLLFRKWDMGMDINPEDKTSYTTHYHEAFRKYMENEYRGKHRGFAVNKLESVPCSNLTPSPTASGSYRSSCDSYDLSSDDEEHLTHNNVAETSPG
jgi:hypothetical protein